MFLLVCVLSVPSRTARSPLVSTQLEGGTEKPRRWPPLFDKLPDISQGSAATRFMRGGIRNDELVTNLPPS